MEINNVPEYAKKYPFWVARIADNELWFYGAYSDWEKALEVSQQIGGFAFENKQ